MEFARVVHDYLAISDVDVDERARRLAAACHVATSTVYRWSRGAAIPGPHVCEYVINVLAGMGVT